MMKLRLVGALPLCLIAQFAAAAPQNITPSEVALVPAYCRYTQSWPEQSVQGFAEGKAAYGEVFLHLHHYCWALVWQLRADRFAGKERSQALAAAMDDFGYVLRQMPANHFLRPEVLTRQAKTQRAMNKTKDAIASLQAAIALDPKYWRAYSELALIYEIANDRPQAASVLREGLKNDPNAKVLSVYLQDLERKGTAKTGAPR